MTEVRQGTQFSRRDFLLGGVVGVLGAAGGPAIYNAITKSPSPQNEETQAPSRSSAETTEVEGSVKYEQEISQEQLDHLKGRALNFAQATFERDGYTGTLQSDHLTAAAVSDSSLLELELDFRADDQDVADLEIAHLTGFSARFTSPFEANTPQAVPPKYGTEPPPTTNFPPSESALARPSFELRVRSTREYQPDPMIDKTPQTTHSYTSVEKHLIEVISVEAQASPDGSPMKPPMPVELLDEAFAVFET